MEKNKKASVKWKKEKFARSKKLDMTINSDQEINEGARNEKKN